MRLAERSAPRAPWQLGCGRVHRALVAGSGRHLGSIESLARSLRRTGKVWWS